MSKHSGRLELTWTNKHLRLLAHEDETRKPPYEWVNPEDYRVSEVRLLHEHETVGDVHASRNRAKDNLLIQGDALCALTSMLELPELAREYAGKVRLVYIDPPFNTGQAFVQYDDGLEHSVWLTMLRDRLEQARALLARDGSVWLHLDDTEAHRARCVLDEVFGAGNFVANIVWEKSHTRENRTDISTAHENIIVYAVDKALWKTRRNLLPSSEEQLERYANPDDDPRGPWASLPLHAKAEKGRRASQFFKITLPAGRVVEPPKGRCWLYTEERYHEVVSDGRVWFGESGGNAPRIKKFLSEVQSGLVPRSIWPHGEVGTTGTAKSELVELFPDQVPFSTPKPERLMTRILQIATNPGDIALDFFLGSGTTAAVAHKMSRRWVGIERSPKTVAEFALPRLSSIVKGEDPGGVTKAVNWTGGGGFRVLDVAPSMFEEDEGLVVLADWATNGKLGEACAAQLGYEYIEEPPFCGLKGKTRLAVVDGLVSPDVAKVLVDALQERERVVICGTSFDPEARTVLKELRPGSTLRKIPASILSEYKDRRRSRLAEALEDSGSAVKVEAQAEVVS